MKMKSVCLSFMLLGLLVNASNGFALSVTDSCPYTAEETSVYKSPEDIQTISHAIQKGLTTGFRFFPNSEVVFLEFVGECLLKSAEGTFEHVVYVTDGVKQGAAKLVYATAAEVKSVADWAAGEANQLPEPFASAARAASAMVNAAATGDPRNVAETAAENARAFLEMIRDAAEQTPANQ